MLPAVSFKQICLVIELLPLREKLHLSLVDLTRNFGNSGSWACVGIRSVNPRLGDGNFSNIELACYILFEAHFDKIHSAAFDFSKPHVYSLESIGDAFSLGNLMLVLIKQWTWGEVVIIVSYEYLQFGQELWLFLNVCSLKKRLSLLTGLWRKHWRVILIARLYVPESCPMYCKSFHSPQRTLAFLTLVLLSCHLPTLPWTGAMRELEQGTLHVLPASVVTLIPVGQYSIFSCQRSTEK